MMRIIRLKDGFRFLFNERSVFTHTSVSPCISIGRADFDFRAENGKSRVSDSTVYKTLPAVTINSTINSHVFHFSDTSGRTLRITFSEENGLLNIDPYRNDTHTALCLRLDADASESVYGCGENFGALDLKGRRVNILVQEHVSPKAVYRRMLQRLFHTSGKTRPFEENGSYYIHPSFLSSGGYFCHIDSSAYGILDFHHPDYTLVHWSSLPRRITLGNAGTWPTLLEKLTAITGRQPPLPSWITRGIILSVDKRTDRSKSVGKMIEAGAEVAGIWSDREDGRRKRRKFPSPGQKEPADNIRLLGYLSPHLARGGALYTEAVSRGYLVMDREGKPYTIKSAGSLYGIVDLTNPDGRRWMKTVIRNTFINPGYSGWMADYGEYLPMDAVLHRGTPEELHNLWPTLWAGLNREAIEEAEAEDNIVFFNRSGFTGTAAESSLVYTGEQFTDFSNDYGIGSFIKAVLSLGLSGIGCVHGDIGGYTTSGPIRRSKELYLRWLELSTFTPVMRTTAGSKPDKNHQFDSDKETIDATARFSRIHATIEPYIRTCLKEYYTRGTPVIRPVFFHYKDPCFLKDASQYLLGRDILVCPVLEKGALSRRANIPKDNWVHLFTGTKIAPGSQAIEAPVGTPVVFFREQSTWADLFESIREY